MIYDEKLKRLKSLHILRQIPERQLVALAEFVRPRELKDGEVLFREGSRGMSLYFVSSGKIRISKQAGSQAAQDLAVLGQGEFFGEMALVEEATRSASAIAVGPCVLFELFRGDLSRWAKSNPQQAVQFFVALVLIQSMRLRRTSNELTLHFDLSSLWLDRGKPAPEFLAEVLDRVVPHLSGPWSAAAYLATGTEPAATRGSFNLAEIGAKVLAGKAAASGWLDASTFQAPLAGHTGRLGHLLFRAPAPMRPEDQEDIGRTLTTVSRLVSSALEIRHLSN